MTTGWNRTDIKDQAGRVAVVTGANAGLGLEIAAGLADAGATVVLACRSLERADAAAADIRRRTPGAELEIRTLDLADLASVRSFAEQLRRDHDRLDLLINNAGLMALDESTTVDGFETQLGVNHLGHHALTAQLLPIMLDVPGSRVVTQSSIGHRAGRLVLRDLMYQSRRYSRWGAYFQSKLANLLFTFDLDRRLARAGSATIAVAAHPGTSATDLGSEGSSVINRLMRPISSSVTQPASTGALPALRAAVGADVRGGQFYGPARLTFGPPVLEVPSRRARRVDDAAALAVESARLTGAELPV
jgi:protochlorophyllide reductase